jgi:hypothetical protein
MNTSGVVIKYTMIEKGAAFIVRSARRYFLG